MTGSVYSRLRNIFGNEVDSLTAGEQAAAERVLRWAFGRDVEDGPKVVAKDETATIAEAIKTAVVEYSGEEWEDVASSRRDRRLTDLRYIAFTLMYEMAYIPKSHVADALGIKRDHASVLYGINACRDWMVCDAGFRSKYHTILTRAKQILDDAKQPEESLDESPQIVC